MRIAQKFLDLLLTIRPDFRMVVAENEMSQMHTENPSRGGILSALWFFSASCGLDVSECAP